MEAGAVRQYHVVLAPATAPLPANAAGPVTVQEWGADPAARDCVHYRDPDHSLYVVLHGDRDCDGRIEQDEPAANECRIGVFDGYRRPGRTSLSCVTLDTIGVPQGQCVLGGAGCMEVPNNEACPLPGNTCLDPEVCDLCAGAADNLECVARLANDASTAAHIDCTFSVVRAPFAACPGPATFLNGERFSRLNNVSCDTNQDFLFYIEGSGKWLTGFAAQGFAFTSKKPTANCDFELAAMPMAATAPTVLAPIHGIASVTLANGRSLATPFNVTFEETTACDGKVNVCKFSNLTPVTMPFASCLTRTVPDPW